MEYREIYRKDCTAAGRIVEKHAAKYPGDYFLHTVVVMKTIDSPAPGEGEGQYIAQQRSLKARYYAGKWDVTGGGVRAGETPKEAIIREVKEELGLDIPAESLTLEFQERIDYDDGTGFHIFMFACRASVPKEGIKWDPYEVNDVKILPFHTFRECVLDHNSDAFGRALDKIEETI